MIGIICAMQIEADGILALCENKEETVKYGMTFTRGTLCGKELVVRGSHGISVVADKLVEQVLWSGGLSASGGSAAVVVPGGMPGAANLSQCQAARDLLGRVSDAGGLVAALCAAPVVVLAGWGLLRGRRYTCYPSMETQLEKWGGSDWKELTAGSQYTGSRVEVDGNLITGAGPGAAEEFSLMLVRRLAGDGAARRLASSALFRK